VECHVVHDKYNTDCRGIRLGFMVDKVALGRIISEFRRRSIAVPFLTGLGAYLCTCLTDSSLFTDLAESFDAMQCNTRRVCVLK
jgi:hypothetical protein